MIKLGIYHAQLLFHKISKVISYNIHGISSWERQLSHYEGNLASTVSHLFVMHALLNTKLSLILQIGCQTRSRTTFVWIRPKRCRKNAMECVTMFPSLR